MSEMDPQRQLDVPWDIIADKVYDYLVKNGEIVHRQLLKDAIASAVAQIVQGKSEPEGDPEFGY